jgi:hypothetical protein
MIVELLGGGAEWVFRSLRVVLDGNCETVALSSSSLVFPRKEMNSFPLL